MTNKQTTDASVALGSVEKNGRNFIRAAQYVRMSTEHQRYSIDNQKAAIDSYAARRNMKIVRTYSDSGKSGLNIEGREGLKRLISDVEVDQVEFDAVLVFDVSRWGRFQDADEAAYYEYICKKAGKQVHYCAEQFDNDGSPISAIVKGIKRTMAGEYSRELSSKVFAGKCRLVEMGYRQGGPAGYGLRRVLVDEHGTRKCTLSRNEQKSLQTDRVILVPGPKCEIRIVNRIYRWFVEQRISEVEIARRLNAKGLTTDLDRIWTARVVHQILSNEKYIGHNVFNRSSLKLGHRRVDNAPDMWIRAEHAFEPIVSRDIFDCAQIIMKERSQLPSNEEMLADLQKLYERCGILSSIAIDNCPETLCSTAYRRRFGSLLQAYSLIGFKPARNYHYFEVNRKLSEYRPEFLLNLQAQFEETGATVSRIPKSDTLSINDEFKVRVIIARHITIAGGLSRWRFRIKERLRNSLTVIVRMNEANDVPLDYYLLPDFEFSRQQMDMSKKNSLGIDAFRYDNLELLLNMARRHTIQEAA